MRGGGFNAENTQLSDGRRVADRKCRDCDNAVNHSRDFLCAGCKVRTFERRQRLSRVRATVYQEQKAAARSDIGELSQALAGLQQSWFSNLGSAA